MLDQEQVLQLFSYDSDTGRLLWRNRSCSGFKTQSAAKIWNKRFAGKRAGREKTNGYRAVKINGIEYLEHRVIWLYCNGVFPTADIDHISGVRSDNRIKNLRDVPKAENGKNKGRPRNNTSGTIGIHWDAKAKKWQAQIKINERRKHLGYFSEVSKAEARRKQAEADLGYHANHGRIAKAPTERTLQW